MDTSDVFKLRKYIVYNNKSKYEIKNIGNDLYNQLIYNEIHKKFKFNITKEDIYKYYKIIIEEEEEVEVIIISMLELNESQLNTYLNLYRTEKEDALDRYAELLSIIIYNNISPERYNIKKELDSILENISIFWDDPNNCNINENSNFVTRKFNNMSKYENSDYLEEIDKYVKNKLNKKYYINKPTNKTNDDINEIYNNIPSEYLKYSFLCNLLSSRSHSHLILNNNNLLDITKTIIDENKIIFKYYINYGWLSLILQEKNTKNIKDTDIFIFDIDTANKLPYIHFHMKI